jgi:hypothetical protein
MKYYILIIFPLLYSCEGQNSNSNNSYNENQGEQLANKYCDCYRYLDDNSDNSMEKMTRCQQDAQDKVMNLSPDEIQQFSRALEICNAKFVDAQSKKQKQELEKITRDFQNSSY